MRSLVVSSKTLWFFLVASALTSTVTSSAKAQQNQPAKLPATGELVAQNNAVTTGNQSSKVAVKGEARTADEEAVRAAAQAFAQAFQSGNSQALTSLFTEQGEYVAEGNEPIRGSEALTKAYTDLFAQWKELKAEAVTDSVRFLSPNTAIEEGTFTVTTTNNPPNASRYSALYVKDQGKWLVANLTEWEDTASQQPTLENLAWLIGTWESKGEGMTARTTYSWVADKAFIRADFTVTSSKEGEQPSTGTQVIGIDPAVGQIRAWLFASDGGIGESIWYWSEDRWVIESAGTLVDGTHTTATNFITNSGGDSYSWRTVRRFQDGEALPDLNSVTVKRVSTPEAASAGATTGTK